MTNIPSLALADLMAGGVNPALNSAQSQLMRQAFDQSLKTHSTYARADMVRDSAASLKPQFYASQKISPVADAVNYMLRQQDMVAKTGKPPINTNDPQLKGFADQMNALVVSQERLTYFAVGTSVGISAVNGVVTASQRLMQA